METSKILSADLLDLIFDDRNKEYGAYELRKTYQHRIKQSIIITFTLTAVIIGGSVLASSLKPEKDYRDDNRVVVVDLIPETPAEGGFAHPYIRTRVRPRRIANLTPRCLLQKLSSAYDTPSPYNHCKSRVTIYPLYVIHVLLPLPFHNQHWKWL